jgi:hypothetical protein
MRLFRLENNVISTPRFDNAGHGNLRFAALAPFDIQRTQRLGDRLKSRYPHRILSIQRNQWHCSLIQNHRVRREPSGVDLLTRFYGLAALRCDAARVFFAPSSARFFAFAATRCIRLTSAGEYMLPRQFLLPQ